MGAVRRLDKRQHSLPLIVISLQLARSGPHSLALSDAKDCLRNQQKNRHSNYFPKTTKYLRKNLQNILKLLYSRLSSR